MLFLDTGYHFPETIGTRDAVSAIYPINLVNVTPSRTVAEQDAELGPRLYGRNPDLCCYLRKVEPLEKSLAPYDAWFTGVRREETASRRDTRVVEWDEKRQMIKVNPIVAWTGKQVDDYIADERRACQPAGLRRLPVDRLPDLHDAGRGGRGPALRPLGRDGQDRMRHPRLTLASADHPPLVAVAHGSKDPRAAATVSDLLDLVAARAADASRAAGSTSGRRSSTTARRRSPRCLASRAPRPR